MPTQQAKTSGVQDLVERLREEGVAEGRKEAAQIVEAARREAAELVDAARREASEVSNEAQRTATRYQAAGEDALRLAVRDALLALRTAIEDRFAARLRQLASERLNDMSFVDQLLRSVAAKAAPKDVAVEVLLPELAVASAAAADKAATAGGEQTLQFVRGLAGNLLREGVTIAASDRVESGFLLSVAEQGFEVRFDEHALAELLRQHLLPRFRVLLDGFGETEGTSGE